MSEFRKRHSERRKMPSSFHNSITLFGAVLAGTALGLILFMIVLESTSSGHHPYMGIIAFVILPVFLVLGLVVGAFGVLRQQRRKRLGLPSTERLPKVDLNEPTHLRATLFVGGTFILFLAF